MQGLNVCKQRYTQILSAEVSAEQGKHAVCSLLGCHVVERYRHGFSDASLREECKPRYMCNIVLYSFWFVGSCSLHLFLSTEHS